MTVDPGGTSEFGKELLRFVTAMGLASKVVQSLSHFDFTRTSHIGFIHSMSIFLSDLQQNMRNFLNLD
jgi:hypothetical protein